jgi:hypothetical protein
MPLPPASAVLERALRRTLARLVAARKQVIVALPNQRMGFDPAECLTALRPLHGPDYRHPCAEPAGSPAMALRLAYGTMLRAIAADYPGVSVVDLAAPLCDARGCYAMRGGHAYRDNLHLSAQGSRAVAPVLYAAISAALRASGG